MKVKYRLVIDTNVWISSLIGFKIKEQLYNVLINNSLALLMSTTLKSEIYETAERPKIKKYYDNNVYSKMVDMIENRTVLIDVKSDVKICRDSDDDFVLSLCKDGKADFLLTSDNDLLIIKKLGTTLIMKLSDFVEQYL